MTAADMKRVASMDPTSLGRLLLDQEPPVVTMDDIADGLRYADTHGMKLGEALVDLGRINGAMLDAMLAQQNLERAETSPEKTRAVAGMVVAASAAATSMHPHIDALAATAMGILKGLGKA